MTSCEDQSSEFKRMIEDPASLAKTICAFANTKGGEIWIGIDDDGTTVGVEDECLDRSQLHLTAAIRMVQPIPHHEISVEKEDEGQVIRARIFPLSDGRFCSFKGLIYYRSGSSNMKLEGTSLHDFLVKRRVIEFDRGPSQAVLDDVSASKVRSFLERRSPTLEFDEERIGRYLTKLEAAYEDGEFHLNNAGVLFFVKQPSEFIPQNEVRCVRFKGKEPIDIFDQKIICETIPETIEYCQEFIARHTMTGMKIEGMRRTDIPEYPGEVVREATVNALAHRDYFSSSVVHINIYDDRIEWVNPVVLPEGITIENLQSISLPRNPLIYRYLRDLGFIEGLGTGIPRIRSSLKRGGYPNPVLEQIGPIFRITVYNKLGSVDDGDGLIERQRKLIRGMRSGDLITSGEYSERYGLSRPTAVKELNDLCSRGLLIRRGKGPTTRYEKTVSTLDDHMINDN